jgi:hypothetical protein
MKQLILTALTAAAITAVLASQARAETFHAQAPTNPISYQQALSLAIDQKQVFSCDRVELSSALNARKEPGTNSTYHTSLTNEIDRIDALKRMSAKDLTYRCKAVSITPDGKIRRR